MSEYIVCPHCHNPLSQSEYVKVVRCRDCEYCGTDETRYAGLGCMKFGFGLCHKDISFGDGYCAWGERREQ